MKRITIAKNGLVEMNQVASTVTRQIEAQTKVNKEIKELENGMILFIDRMNDEVTTSVISGPYLMHSTERYYTAGARDKASFIFDATGEELPRLFKLTEGDVFHTNVIGYDDTEFTSEAAFLAETGRMYGYANEGVIYVSGERQDNATEFIVEKSTMQDDTIGYMVIVNRAESVGTASMSI